ncbi:hypothetical protein BG000_011918 [Podila horticola]|nr:hypothetical protein BG000_011918 [Podila horticola]
MDNRPVRGSSRTNDSMPPHPNVVLSPLPPQEHHQQNVASYDLYESDYPAQTQSPHPMQSPVSPASSAGWNNSNYSARSNTNISNTTADADTHSHATLSDSTQFPASGNLDLDLGALSLDDNKHDGGEDMTSLPLRFSDPNPEPQKPVERTGYADDTRYSGSDQGHPPSGPTGSFEPGVVLTSPEASQSPQRAASVDSTHSTVRAYAAGNPNATTYTESSASHAVEHPSPNGAPGYGQPGYAGQDYSYKALHSQAMASILNRILDTNSSTQEEDMLATDTKVATKMASLINTANRMAKNMDRITTRILSSSTMAAILVKAMAMNMGVDIVPNNLALALLSNTMAAQVVLEALEILDEMRQRARTSNDPAAQLEYAKALIEAAVSFGNDDPDPKRQKKNKEALFMEGLKIIKRLATTGMGIGKPAYPDAQFFLANCYGNGSLGLQIDHDKAFNLYMQASKQNHPAATYRTAVCYELGAGTKRDHSRAVQFYRKAASLGDTAAMYKLGMVILKGLLGQQNNPREAITWLKRAAANADEDNPHALHELGLCFEKAGIPTVIPDEGYARELFTQAAGYGYGPSQFKLGHCYEYGALTCPVDPRRSIAWYTRAAEQGDAESELGLSGWYLTGSEGVLKQSDTEAYLWARKAADKGLARAEYAVGYYSEVGIGVRQDPEEARRWYLRSAAQGNGRAKKRLTEMKKLGAARRVRPERGRQNPQGEEEGDCRVM